MDLHWRLIWSIMIFTVFFISEGIESVKLLELRVPQYVPLGARAQLGCRWRLSPSDVLYSVKWYKDGREFFRFVPRDLELRRRFPLPGVDVEKSDACGSNLTLSPAALETGGRYRCEVSGEGPLFPTVSDHADMEVVALPSQGPAISGLLGRYHVGDQLQVSCASGRSRPAARLAWFLNGEPAPAAALLPSTRILHDDGLHTTSLALHLKLTEQHFKGNALKIKCLATIGSIYWKSNEESTLKGNTIFYNEVNEETFPDEQMDSRADKVHFNHSDRIVSSSLIIIVQSVLLCFIIKSFKY